jgi:YfiH family protein
MQRCEQNSLVYYQFETFVLHHLLNHGVFTRLGGFSEGPFSALNVGSTVGDNDAHVAKNRHLLARAMNVRDEDIRTVWQVHGAEVLAVDAETQSEWPPVQADGIVTNAVNVPLVMRFADCVPVLLYDPVQNAAGIAHAGWKGTLLGAGVTTLEAMSNHYGTHPEDVIAGIGPSIGPCCYEVGREVVYSVQEAFASAEQLIIPSVNGGGPHFDLWAANETALREAGIRHIEVAHICTACNTNEFYSHRREQGKTGRFGVLLTLRGDHM